MQRMENNPQQTWGNAPLQCGLNTAHLFMVGYEFSLINIGGKPFVGLEPVAAILGLDVWMLIERAESNAILLATLSVSKGEATPLVELSLLVEIIPDSALQGAIIAKLLCKLWSQWSVQQLQLSGFNRIMQGRLA
ncbi:MAG: hypothetical protein Q9O24_02640 [Gammaproteobacteria bacterium]|nr:hypothetical protein [Gammaproteobacteria bacterium]